MRSGVRSPVFKRRHGRVIRVNPRKVIDIQAFLGGTARQKVRHPGAMPYGDLFDRRSIDTAPPFWKVLQLLQGRVEEPKTSGIRAALHVVIGRRELNQSLQKEVN